MKLKIKKRKFVGTGEFDTVIQTFYHDVVDEDGENWASFCEHHDAYVVRTALEKAYQKGFADS